MEYLDQAIRLAEQEMTCLREGRVDEAYALAGERQQLLAASFGSARTGEGSDAQVLERLRQLLETQKTLGQQAREMAEATLEELRRAGQESRRHTGYREGNRATMDTQSALLNKHG